MGIIEHLQMDPILNEQMCNEYVSLGHVQRCEPSGFMSAIVFSMTRFLRHQHTTQLFPCNAIALESCGAEKLSWRRIPESLELDTEKLRRIPASGTEMEAGLSSTHWATTTTFVHHGTLEQNCNCFLDDAYLGATNSHITQTLQKKIWAWPKTAHPWWKPRCTQTAPMSSTSNVLLCLVGWQQWTWCRWLSRGNLQNVRVRPANEGHDSLGNALSHECVCVLPCQDLNGPHVNLSMVGENGSRCWRHWPAKRGHWHLLLMHGLRQLVGGRRARLLRLRHSFGQFLHRKSFSRGAYRVLAHEEHRCKGDHAGSHHLFVVLGPSRVGRTTNGQRHGDDDGPVRKSAVAPPKPTVPTGKERSDSNISLDPQLESEACNTRCICKNNTIFYVFRVLVARHVAKD